MTSIDYSDSQYPVREGLVSVHEKMVKGLARSGTWWTGAERRAIALEARAARDCALCAERKQALSPFSVDGDHDGSAELAPEIVDVIHRIVTDPGRLAKSWYERVMSQGSLTPEQYVELVSVTVQMNALDVFARAVGSERAELPAAVDGAPTQQRPATAKVEGAWVPQIPVGEAGGDDWAALYAGSEFVPQIGRALSLVPAEVVALNDVAHSHYMDIKHVGDPKYSEPGRGLDRLQMELIASRVSAVNECFY